MGLLIGTGVLISKDYQLDDREDVASWFEPQDSPWLLELPAGSIVFVSESVDQANDQGTPLGLRWFSSRYTGSNPFPFADISRPSDTVFRCGQCKDKTNPCWFDGECNEDGACTCQHGAKNTTHGTKSTMGGTSENGESKNEKKQSTKHCMIRYKMYTRTPPLVSANTDRPNP
jgi:hypothetical protein